MDRGLPPIRRITFESGPQGKDALQTRFARGAGIPSFGAFPCCPEILTRFATLPKLGCVSSLQYRNLTSAGFGKLAKPAEIIYHILFGFLFIIMALAVEGSAPVFWHYLCNVMPGHRKFIR